MTRSLCRFEGRSWCPKSDQANLEAVSMALREAQRSGVWTQQPFVVELLQVAETFGEECRKTVGSNLSKVPIFNSGLGETVGGQAADAGELLSNARRIVNELPIGSAASRFYRELANHAEQMMQWISSSPLA